MADHDPLALIARSYEMMASAASLTATTQLLLARMQASILLLLGLALLVLGFTVWQHVVMQRESRLFSAAMATQGQRLDAQTQAMVEMMRTLLERQRQP